MTKDSLTDPTLKQATLAFSKKKNFHQILRNEILFSVAPRTLQSSVEQRNAVFAVINSLGFGGFLRNEGFKQLGTMIEMSKVCNEELRFNFKASGIDTFCRSGSRQWPVLMVDNATHVVTLKGHKTENGILKLNIRDSARDPNSSAEIWIEKNNSLNNQMNLSADMCIYFELL